MEMKFPDATIRGVAIQAYMTDAACFINAVGCIPLISQVVVDRDPQKRLPRQSFF